MCASWCLAPPDHIVRRPCKTSGCVAARGMHTNAACRPRPLTSPFFATTPQRCFLRPPRDLLDMQPIPVSVAHKLPRGGAGKVGANNQRRRIRIFREYPAAGSDGGVVVHV